jgi:lipopolysaccharide/colanic/teichoic acid biosynthesis glycosyltransferase
LNEKSFKRTIAVERKRSERSKEPFLLMLVEVGSHSDSRDAQRVLDSMIAVLLAASRDTDVIGWYRERATLGVMFTGLVVTDKSLILTTILNRISNMLRDELTFDQFSQVSLSFHFFPDDWDHSSPEPPANATLYPDLMNPPRRKRGMLLVKRVIDLCVGALGLAILSPLLLLIAVAIKLTSKGPVLFKQQRVGQYGKLFTVLKFRSMHANNDVSVHKEYVMKLIKDQADKKSTGEGEGVYKLTNDRRITPIGSFLRRTSLDELPQIFNVLTGEMSLVGPRPAIPYELAAYQSWHRRRILEAKPGITGLWQVTGRSLVKFDDMVRMDLRYANSWSLWLDLKILLMTPRAVIKGAGAY